MSTSFSRVNSLAIFELVAPINPVDSKTVAALNIPVLIKVISRNLIPLVDRGVPNTSTTA